MASKRKKQNLRLSLVMEVFGLLVLGVCLWLDLRTEAAVIGGLLVLNMLITGASLWSTYKDNKSRTSTGKIHKS